MISFVKMHGNSNDFVIIDCRITDYRNVLNYGRIANRKIGVGCDQVILIDNSDIADCLMHIYNADGSKVEMCGNAARCVAFLMMREKGSSNTKIELSDRILDCYLISNFRVQVNMGKPRFFWKDIPLKEECDTLSVPLKFELLSNPVAVNIGNTHAIFFLDEIDDIPLSRLGPIIENHSIFSNRTNVGIAQVLSRRKIKLRIWERGVGETDCCGSAACAALVAASKLRYADREADVGFKGGDLTIKWEVNDDILMSGDIACVFHGQYNCN